MHELILYANRRQPLMESITLGPQPMIKLV